MSASWHVSKALASYRSLLSVIQKMTEQEVLQALDIEANSQRRPVITDKLIQKAAELNRRTYIKNLKEKYHGESKKRNSDPS